MERTISSDSEKTVAMLAASQTFDRILELIQKSNLNFVLQVSPFSANISLKKSLVKDKCGTVRLPPECDRDEALTAMKARNSELENSLLKMRGELEAATDNCEAAYAKINLLEKEKDGAIKTIEILEQKIAKAEASTLKLFEEKKTNIEALKNQIKPLNIEISDYKKEITCLKKSLKDKDKSLYKLHIKCQNLETSFKRSKSEIASIKSENKKKIRREALENNKKEDISSQAFFSLNDIPLIESTESSDAIPLGLPDTTLSDSLLNNNIRQPVTCPQLSSPHTPPGPPPVSEQAATPVVSPRSPRCEVLAVAKVSEANAPETKDLVGIRKVENKYDLEKLLEIIKNAELPSDDELDDNYENVDFESYPDYYWEMGYETDDGKHFELSE